MHAAPRAYNDAMQWSEPSAGTVKGFKNQVLLQQSQNLVYNHKAKPSKAEEENMDNNGNKEAHMLEAAEVAVLCQGRQRCTPEAAGAAVLCCVYKIFKGQAGLCLHSEGDAGKEGSPGLPKAACQCQGEQRCTPEAAEAVLCQGELLCTLEAAEAAFLCQGRLMCTPEAAEATDLCQGRLLCTPEAAEAAVLCCVYKIFKGQAGLCLHSGDDAGKEGSPRLPKAAFQCQGELLSTPEAAEAVLCQGELLCTPEAAEATVLCQGRLLCTPEAAEAAVLAVFTKSSKARPGCAGPQEVMRANKVAHVSQRPPFYAKAGCYARRRTQRPRYYAMLCLQNLQRPGRAMLALRR
jgi:hypothetical protein